MRGLQWWNSSWDIGSADTVVWTDRRSLRRARAVRHAKLAVAVLLAAAVGTLVALAVARRGFAPEPEAGIQVGACRSARTLALPL